MSGSSRSASKIDIPSVVSAKGIKQSILGFIIASKVVQTSQKYKKGLMNKEE